MKRDRKQDRNLAEVERPAGQSKVSITSGVTNSECLMPIEKAGGRGLCTMTFSGLCEPGPGLQVLSRGRLCRLSMENAGCLGK